MMEEIVSKLELETLGYTQYKSRTSPGTYPESILSSILAHRNAILEKYRHSADKKVQRQIGMGIARGMFIPADYDGVVVDAEDVFAAVYSHEYAFLPDKKRSEEFMLWILFTNDSYIPVLPLVCMQKNSFWDAWRKQKRNDYRQQLEAQCRRLCYPICSIDEFEELISKENRIKGRIEKRFLTEQLYDAKSRIGLYEPRTISSELGERTMELLRAYEYDLSQYE